jgi:hypothetical protein
VGQVTDTLVFNGFTYHAVAPELVDRQGPKFTKKHKNPALCGPIGDFPQGKRACRGTLGLVWVKSG